MAGAGLDRGPEFFGFLVVPDFSMIAFTAAVEPLRLANRVAEKDLYRWRVISKDGGPVTASNGITVTPAMSLGEMVAGGSGKVSTVILCSGIGAERYDDREVFGMLRRLDRRGTVLGALCTGAQILARAGLMGGYKCAIHWENLPAFTEAFPDIDVASHLFEIDRNRLTCCGGTAALDMMVHLIGLDHGEDLALQVSEQCLVDRVRHADVDQRMALRVRLGGHHPKLVEAISIMEANLEEPLPADELARSVNLSQRQLERLFGKHLRRSPTQYYVSLRLQRARLLLSQTDLPVFDVALACGFVSASHFSKTYRQHFGLVPRDERRRHLDVPAKHP